MTPLPGALGGGAELVAWRLERTIHVASWEQAEGAFKVGGRWSSAGRRVVYASLDPATTIMEVAVHKGFDVLDAVPHTLLQIRLEDPAGVYVVPPTAIPNPSWLRPGTVSPNQQAFGDDLLDAHAIVVIPSVASTHSWNVLIDTGTTAGLFDLASSEPFALDPRLTPAGHVRKP